jgi:hypothetical protein
MAREEIVSENVVVKQAPVVGFEAVAYLNQLVSLGAVEGAVGRQQLNASLAPVIAALHQVLAGGTVRLEVTTPGHLPIVAGLDRQLASAIHEANTMNSFEEYLGEVNV